MVKKNILIISYFFAPNSMVGAKRMSYLSYFLKDKFNFFILTNKEKDIVKKDKLLKYSGKRIEVKEFPKFVAPHTNFINKLYNKIFKKIAPVDIFSGWVFLSILKGYKIIKKYNIDKIIVSGPPFSHFYIGYTLSKFNKIPLVLDYRDPWLLNHNKSKIEKKILQQAADIIFTTSKAEEGYLESEFGSIVKGKTGTITNAFVKRNDSVIKLEENKKVIFYAGNFYKERKLSYLFKPLQKLCEDGLLEKDEIKIHVFGNLLKEDLEELNKINWKNLVVQHDLVPHNEIFSFMKGADLLYLPQVTYGEYAIPYKFFDYVSVQKPIMAITSKDSSTAKIIEETQCGEISQPNDFDSIYLALKNILVLKKEYKYNNKKLSWETISNKFYNVLSK